MSVVSQSQSDSYKKGDILIKFGKVYEIFKTSVKKVNDKKQSIIFYKRLYKEPARDTIISSIPIKNLQKANIRKPFMKKKIESFLQLLREKQEAFEDISFRKKNVLLSDMDEKAEILKSLWNDKTDEELSFPLSKKRMFQSVVDSVKEEIAYVYKIDLKEAEKKILKALQKGT